VTAEHDDDTSLEAVCIYYRFDDSPEITGNQYVGQRFQECAEAQVAARRRRELLRPNFIRTTLDRNGADLGQIRFWSYLRVVWPVGGVYDFR
jgi:hypothetical protein